MAENNSKEKNPTLEALEVREKRLDLYKKIAELRRAEERYKTERTKEDLEIEKKELECLKLRQPNGFLELLFLASATILDEDNTIMDSEPKFKNLFDEKERQIIKNKILNKVKLL